MAIQLRHRILGVLLLTASVGVWADDLYRDDVYVWENHSHRSASRDAESASQTQSSQAGCSSTQANAKSEKKTIIIVDKKDEKPSDNHYKSGKKTDPNWQKQTAEQATVTIVDKK